MRRIAREPEAYLRQRYGACTACGLSALRRHVVIGRGVIPADLLLVGIGPGANEDLRAVAFFGRAGRILNGAVVDAGRRACWTPTIYMTNVVACRPWDGEGVERVDPDTGKTYISKGENRDPWPNEASACRPRLHETIALVKPQRVVALGSYVRTEIARSCPDAIHLQHPAFLAREGLGSPYYNRFVAGLADVFSSLRDERRMA